MAVIQFSIVYDAGPKDGTALPYTVWNAVKRYGKESDGIDAWISLGEPGVRSHGRPEQLTYTVYPAEDPLRPMAVIRADTHDGKKASSFIVYDAGNNELCRVSRTRSPLRVRSAWRVDVRTSKNPIVGYHGTWYAWLLFIISLPVWIPLTLFSLIAGLLESGTGFEYTWEPPRRMVWRRRPNMGGSRKTLDYRGIQEYYRWDPDQIDKRIAYAQAITHASVSRGLQSFV